MTAEQQVERSSDAQRQIPRYRFREGIWEVICEQMGWKTTFAAAEALGVYDTTITRGLLNGPGERLMAAVMAAVPPPWKFDLIFELVAA